MSEKVLDLKQFAYKENVYLLCYTTMFAMHIRIICIYDNVIVSIYHYYSIVVYVEYLLLVIINNRYTVHVRTQQVK